MVLALKPLDFAREANFLAPGLSVPGIEPIEPFKSGPIALGSESPIIPSGKKNLSKAPASKEPCIIPFPPWSK